MAYIEDETTRLTVLTGSPLGASSLREGHIEVMLDRRLNQDDNLGLGQAVLDNHPTKHVFRIILEQKTHSCRVIHACLKKIRDSTCLFVGHSRGSSFRFSHFSRPRGIANSTQPSDTPPTNRRRRHGLPTQLSQRRV
jgi:hypothetical protein